MLKNVSFLFIIFMLLIAQNAVADAPLKGKLSLDTDQAKIVYEIQAKHRNLKRSSRQSLNREARALRRARSANDSALIAQQESIVRELEGVMKNRILSEDEEIRLVLTPEQLGKFERYVEERNQMAGSSRDMGLLKP